MLILLGIHLSFPFLNYATLLLYLGALALSSREPLKRKPESRQVVEIS